MSSDEYVPFDGKVLQQWEAALERKLAPQDPVPKFEDEIRKRKFSLDAPIPSDDKGQSSSSPAGPVTFRQALLEALSSDDDESLASALKSPPFEACQLDVALLRSYLANEPIGEQRQQLSTQVGKVIEELREVMMQVDAQIKQIGILPGCSTRMMTRHAQQVYADQGKILTHFLLVRQSLQPQTCRPDGAGWGWLCNVL